MEALRSVAQGFLNRRHFRPGEDRAQEIVRDRKAPVRPVEQRMAGTDPEIPWWIQHCHSPACFQSSDHVSLRKTSGQCNQRRFESPESIHHFHPAQAGYLSNGRHRT